MSDPEQFNEYQQVRFEKLAALRAAGMDPYPLRSARSHTSRQAIAALDDEGSRGDAALTVAGRVVTLRNMGKSAFLHIEDGAGRVQLYLRRDRVGEEAYELFRKMVDLGDIVEATGTMFRTRTGEATVQVGQWRLLAKALNQPPDKYHGLTDIEQRTRERYVDLLANEEVRQRFITRSRITSLVRRYLEEQGYIEVETPILQPLYGGAAARPFVTHHNWAGRDYFLRIADELYLKRLIVGGLEKVFEIGKDFRNEGISYKHSPEFTMLEAYEAFGDYQSMMRLVQGCWLFLAEEIHGGPRFPYGDHEIDLTPPWQQITMRDAILEQSGIDILRCDTLGTLLEALGDRQIDRQPTWGRQVDEIFSTLVEPHLIQPTYITDYPYELSPFAKRIPDEPRLVERFELFIAGVECANAFSELNDPLDQAQRFREQRADAERGDDESQPIDQDYINALMYGMPPTGGIGWGMDRMVMILTNQQNIREVILFPQLRDSGADGTGLESGNDR